MAIKTFLDESGAALLMAIMFTLIINGIALTMFATTSNEMESSNSSVIASDSFNVAEAGLNLGLLRLKAMMEANLNLDPTSPFCDEPFNLALENTANVFMLSDIRYFDLVRMAPLDSAALDQIKSSYIDDTTATYIRPIDGFFLPECSNPDQLKTYLTGAEPIYSSVMDTGESALLRGWRVYIANDNDKDDKTAVLVSIGYLLDTKNDVLYKKRIEATVYIHGVDLSKKPNPTGQVSSSPTGAQTGRFRVDTQGGVGESTYDLR